jgi:hypothetical protein
MSGQNFLFKSYVPSIIETIDNNLKLTKEFEVRFNQLVKSTKDRKSNDFKTPIEVDTFIRIKNYLTSKYGTPIETHSEDKVKDGIRQSVITTEDGHEKTITIEKNRLWDSKQDDSKSYSRRTNLFDELGLKLSIASETDVSDRTFKDLDIIRNKHRFTWKEGMFQFDITQVTSTEKGKPTDSAWEVEIELQHPLFNPRTSKLSNEEKETLYDAFNKLSFKVLDLMKIVNNTDLVYTNSDKKRVEDFMTAEVNFGNYRDKEDFIAKARNLRAPDIVFGGLVGGKTDYTVTPKAEGLHKFLVISDFGVWLVYPGKEYCLIEKAPSNAIQYGEWKWFPYRGTVLDGEDILPQQRKPESGYMDIKHFFLPFDTLLYCREDVRNRPLGERQKMADTLRSAVGSNASLLIKMKPFIPLGRSSEEFYNSMNKVFEMIKYLDYNTDGVVFTPINSNYKPGGERLKREERVLTRAADICKWKPGDEYTIDLKVIQTADKRGLFASKGDENIPFKGDDWNSFDAETQVDWYDPMFSQIPNYTIVEFGPKLNSDGKRMYTDDEETKLILKPIRIRPDKLYANGVGTAIDTWKELNDPLEKETLLGNTIILMRKYHNQVKREIFDNISGFDNHLIDIGSGRGGDITKLKHFSKILAIEPNAKNMEEFKRRLSQKSPEIQNKFATLQAGGEEYETIINAVRSTFGNDFGRKPLYISMMLSLSFFWSSREMLEQLANTINLIKDEYYRSIPKELKTVNGPKHPLKFLFFTIEGERTVKFLEENDNSVKLNGVIMSYKNGVVYIDIRGSIVEDQTEYPVILKELFEITGMKSLYQKDATHEKLLSKNEKQLTSLYVYGETELPPKSIYLFRKSLKAPVSSEEEIINLEETEVLEAPELSVNNTLFESLFRAFNPESKDYIDPRYVILYRKEFADAIDKTNPYDLDRRSIFESAGNGFLEKVSIDVDHAKAWIFSNNELTPEYISWIPDVIGANIVVNGHEFKTSMVSGDVINLDYEPTLKVYTLI